MPRKSTINHRGDIFVHPKTMRCKRDKNALYGHSLFTSFFRLGYTIDESYRYKLGETEGIAGEEAGQS
jgi:hypothetical protein